MICPQCQAELPNDARVCGMCRHPLVALNPLAVAPVVVLVLAQAADAGLTDAARLHKLATWFDAANRTRDLLRTTVRGDLAVVDLLLAWRGGDRARATKGERG